MAVSLDHKEATAPCAVMVAVKIEKEFLELKQSTSIVLWRTTSIQQIDLQQQFGQRSLFDLPVTVCL